MGGCDGIPTPVEGLDHDHAQAVECKTETDDTQGIRTLVKHARIVAEEADKSIGEETRMRPMRPIMIILT